MEVHKMQKKLPDRMMNLMIKKLDERNMGKRSFNASCIIQLIEKSNNDLKQSLIQHISNSIANRNVNVSQRIINQTVLNPSNIEI